MKNGPRVWAFCKIEFPGIQKPVQILAQKSGFFRNPGNRGVGVIWRVRRLFWGLRVGVWLWVVGVDVPSLGGCCGEWFDYLFWIGGYVFSGSREGRFIIYIIRFDNHNNI